MKDISVKALWERTLRAYRGDSAASDLARGGTWSFIFRVATMGVAAVSQFVLVKVLGDDGYGQYTYLFGWLNIVMVVAVFNFDFTTVKYVSMYSSSRQRGLLRGFERVALSFTGLLSLSFAAGLAAIVWWAPPARIAELQIPALIVCASLPLLTWVTLTGDRLQGRKLIAQSHVYEVLRPTVLLSCVAFTAFLLQRQVDVVTALVFNFSALAVAAAVSSVLARRAAADSRGAAAEYRAKEWFGVAVGLLPMALAQMALGSRIDIVIVGSLVDMRASGVYSIAVLLLTPSTFVIQSMGTIAAPMIADLYSNGRVDELRRLLKLVARVNLGFTIPVVLAIYAVSPIVLSWLGASFVAGYPVVILFGIATISSAIGGHAALMLTMTGHHHRASVIIGVSAVANLVLAVALGYTMGVNGVAAASTIALVGRSVALTVSAQRMTGVSLMPF